MYIYIHIIRAIKNQKNKKKVEAFFLIQKENCSAITFMIRQVF